MKIKIKETYQKVVSNPTVQMIAREVTIAVIAYGVASIVMYGLSSMAEVVNNRMIGSGEAETPSEPVIEIVS